MLRKLILSVALFLFAGSSIAQDKPAKEEASHGFIGVKKCIMCHKGEAKGNVYEKWLESKHAHAMATLVNKKDGSEKNPKCLECHTVGLDKGGYAVGAATAAEYENVQCESCHGAGADYKLTHSKDLVAAAAQGFIAKPDENTCKQCHNERSPTFDKAKPFNFEEMHKKIDHRYRDKAKAGK